MILLVVHHAASSDPFHTFQHWVSHFFGLSNEPGSNYAFWSGIGSDIGEVAIIGGLWAAYRKHNCHQDGCWRLGKHPVGDGTLIVCRKHHPGVPDKVTAAHVKAAHDG